MISNGKRAWALASILATLLLSIATWNFVNLKQEVDRQKAQEVGRAEQVAALRWQLQTLQFGSDRNRRLLVQVARKLKIEVEE